MAIKAGDAPDPMNTSMDIGVEIARDPLNNPIAGIGTEDRMPGNNARLIRTGTPTDSIYAAMEGVRKEVKAPIGRISDLSEGNSYAYDKGMLLLGYYISLDPVIFDAGMDFFGGLHPKNADFCLDDAKSDHKKYNICDLLEKLNIRGPDIGVLYDHFKENRENLKNIYLALINGDAKGIVLAHHKHMNDVSD